MRRRHLLVPSLALIAGVVTAAVVTPARDAHAFCGFYVAPSDQPLYADATMVALMREGTRTVLSMSNNYKGPAADFAMVVPVPVVLQKDNVKTLSGDVFSKLEKLSAPRLVEYWEQDPCAPEMEFEAKKGAIAAAPMGGAGGKADDGKDLGVKVEAQFTVGEYDIVILSAKESDGLETWLHENKYNIPNGAASALAPYVKEQMKFFVAKVDITKVKRDDQGVAVLSPLRFSYESTDFKLPVRLGLLNASGKQDLIVYVLAKNKRYEVTNYTNAFIPTNLDVTDDTKNKFSPFYATLFDATLAKAGGRAVVTEYSWASGSCDPCPTPPLEDDDVATLGGDVLYGMTSSGAPGATGDPLGGYYGGGATYDVVLTRLHTRYDATTLTEDLVFREAEKVVGGREFVVDDKGNLEKGARKDPYQNNFQARYAIRHPWTGKIECPSPRRGIWGGPPGSDPWSKPPPAPATKLAAAPRGNITISQQVKKGLDDLASWDQAAGMSAPVPANIASTAGAGPEVQGGPLLPDTSNMPQKKACACDFRGAGDSMSWAWGSIALIGLLFARRSRSGATR
jgi:hypothetical protein